MLLPHRREDTLLILPGVWDRASARLLATAHGVRALATTSAGIAAAHGVPDGQYLDREEMLAAVARIVSAVDMPVVADIENGYGDVYLTVRAAIDVGVEGVSLCDALPGDGWERGRLRDLAEAARRVATARRAAEDAGVRLFLCARTEVWWSDTLSDPAARYAEGVTRLSAYRDEGADCVGAPGYVGDAAAVAELVDTLEGGPLDLLADPRLPDLATLERCGVCQLSTGSLLYRIGLSSAGAALTGLFDKGPAELGCALTYADLARLMEG